MCGTYEGLSINAQTKENATAFYRDSAGVAGAMAKFLGRPEVVAIVCDAAEVCQDEVQSLIEDQGKELAAEAEKYGINVDTKDVFQAEFADFFRMFCFVDHIEVLWGYGCADADVRLLNALTEGSQVLYRLAESVCTVMCSMYYNAAYEALERLVDEIDEEDNEPLTCDVCLEPCEFADIGKKIGHCLKGQEFVCNGMGKSTGECDCPCASVCGETHPAPCEKMQFYVTPPCGGCREKGI